jgi:hypothetical protein
VSKYTELDAAILEEVDDLRKRPGYMRTGSDIRSRIFNNRRGLLTQEQWDTGAFVIDRRLQAFRKAGVLTYSSATGWIRIEQETTNV